MPAQPPIFGPGSVRIAIFRPPPSVFFAQRLALPTERPPRKPGSFFDGTSSTKFEVGGKVYEFTPLNKLILLATAGASARFKVVRSLERKVFNAVVFQTHEIRSGERLKLLEILKQNADIYSKVFIAGLAAKKYLGFDFQQEIVHPALSPFVRIHVVKGADKFVRIRLTDAGTGALIEDLVVDPEVRG